MEALKNLDHLTADPQAATHEWQKYTGHKLLAEMRGNMQGVEAAAAELARIKAARPDIEEINAEYEQMIDALRDELGM